jgi:hypothetical protein
MIWRGLAPEERRVPLAPGTTRNSSLPPEGEKMANQEWDNYRKKTISEEAQDELDRATAKFGPFASAHEGYSVLLEEMDELWDEVKTKNRSIPKMREEAIQVAAMAMRFVMDICDK